MRRFQTLTLAAMLTAALLASSGCGYTTASQYPSDVETVFVPIWTRGQGVYRRDLEMRLTEAIQKEIVNTTHYRITSRAKADTELSGRIERISQQVLSKNPETGLPRELELTLHLSFTWKDLRNGKIRQEHPNFKVSDSYIVDRAVGEEFFDGSESAINRAARRIVEQMESDWPSGS